MKINKKVVKFILALMIVVTIGLFINNYSDGWNMNLSLYDGDPEGGNAGKAVTNIMGAVINIVSTVGAGIAIIMLVVIGIEYTSKGAEGKAEAKKDLTGYVVGAVILFGVSGILKLLQMFIKSNLNDIS